MKKVFVILMTLALCIPTIQAQEIDEGSLKKATGWVANLKLNDQAKEERLTKVIATHLAAIREWHNTHGNMIPDGAINPTTGKKLSAMDRSVIPSGTARRTECRPDTRAGRTGIGYVHRRKGGLHHESLQRDSARHDSRG